MMQNNTIIIKPGSDSGIIYEAKGVEPKASESILPVPSIEPPLMPSQTEIEVPVAVVDPPNKAQLKTESALLVIEDYNIKLTSQENEAKKESKVEEKSIIPNVLASLPVVEQVPDVRQVTDIPIPEKSQLQPEIKQNATTIDVKTVLTEVKIPKIDLNLNSERHEVPTVQTSLSEDHLNLQDQQKKEEVKDGLVDAINISSGYLKAFRQAISLKTQNVISKKKRKTTKIINPSKEYFRLRKKVLKQAKRYSIVGIILAIMGGSLLAFAYAPSVYYWGQSMLGHDISTKVIGTAFSDTTLDQAKAKTNSYIPPYDPALPSGNWLIISSIGVDTPINEAPDTDYEEALKKGVWRQSKFSTPIDRGFPTILSAHRFGYVYWSQSFRKTNSFYNLPKLKIGDIVEIDWQQRRYRYLVYGEETAEMPSDLYSADLVLYTCQDLTSPIRIYKYARLMEE
jgi:sortase (surface protein transpeptidase)